MSDSYFYFLKKREGYKRLFHDIDIKPPLYPLDFEHADRVLEKLDWFEREIIDKFYFESKTPEQISGPRGISPATVESIKKRALKKIKSIYMLHLI